MRSKATVGHSDDMDALGVYCHEIAGEMQRAAKIIDTVFNRMLSKIQVGGRKI